MTSQTTQRSSHYDALIVGARCAGAATALWLARAGMRVLVVDRAHYGSDTLSTHALMRLGVAQVRRLGLLPRLCALGAPPVRTTLFSYATDSGREQFEIAIKPRDGVDALYAPRRLRFDRMLVDAAREAGAEVRFGVRLSQLERDARGRVCGALLGEADGGVQRVRASWVIGADGRRSTVARLAGAEVTYLGSHTTATRYAYYSGLQLTGDNAAYRWLYAPRAAAGVIPSDSGLHCVFGAVSPERYATLRRAPEADGVVSIVREVAPEVADALSRAKRVGKEYRFAGEVGYLRRPWGPGFALVGDAGAFRDPDTAHGMSEALRDAQLLSSALLSANEAALCDYERARNTLCRPLFDLSDRIASFDWSLSELQELHYLLNRSMAAQCEAMQSLSPAPDGSEAAA